MTQLELFTAALNLRCKVYNNMHELPANSGLKIGQAERIGVAFL